MNNLSTVINKDNYSHSNHLILTLFFFIMGRWMTTQWVPQEP